MKLLILLGLVAAASAISFLEVSKEEWNNFKVRIFIYYVHAFWCYCPKTTPEIIPAKFLLRLSYLVLSVDDLKLSIFSSGN